MLKNWMILEQHSRTATASFGFTLWQIRICLYIMAVIHIWLKFCLKHRIADHLLTNSWCHVFSFKWCYVLTILTTVPTFKKKTQIKSHSEKDHAVGCKTLTKANINELVWQNLIISFPRDNTGQRYILFTSWQSMCFVGQSCATVLVALTIELYLLLVNYKIIVVIMIITNKCNLGLVDNVGTYLLTHLLTYLKLTANLFKHQSQ